MVECAQHSAQGSVTKFKLGPSTGSGWGKFLQSRAHTFPLKEEKFFRPSHHLSCGGTEGEEGEESLLKTGDTFPV